MALIRGALEYCRPGGRRRGHRGGVREHRPQAKDFQRTRRDREAGRGARHQYLDSRHCRDRGGDARGPQDVIGLHFFAPANVMPLLEVVRTDATSPAGDPHRAGSGEAAAQDTGAGARVLRLHRQSDDGGICSRGRAHGAGGRDAAPGRRCARGVGHGDGHSGGVRHGGHRRGRQRASRRTPTAIRRIPTYYQADFALHAAGRLGQKNGKGYYRYLPGDRTRHDDPEAIEILQDTALRLAIPQRAHSDEEIVERCLYPLINEGIRILEEGVALRAERRRRGVVRGLWFSAISGRTAVLRRHHRP